MTYHHRAETAADLAAKVSLSALLICLAREVAAMPPRSSLWHFPVPGGGLEVRLARVLRTGMPPIAALVHQTEGGGHPVTPAEALDLLLAQLCADHPRTGSELAARIRASHLRIAALIQARRGGAPDPLDFLAAEQAVIFGHWMHPAPKFLGGITALEDRTTTPDWRGALRLHALQVDAALLESSGSFDLPGFEQGLLPVHPLTWDRLQRRPDVQALLAQGAIRDLGPRGPLWHATSSVRTLWSAESPWMVKVSLPVVITNSERLNKRHELLAGVAMARHLAALPGPLGPLRILTDPAWATLRLPGQAESGFEIILRENPYGAARGGAVLQVAALTAPGIGSAQSMLARLLAGQDSLRWFSAYLDVAVVPVLRLYDATGIAFEAHQQNVLLALENGLPVRADLRDNQGFYVVEEMAPPALRDIPNLCYSRRDAEEALSYTLLVNQIFGMIHRLDIDGLLPESEGLAALSRVLLRLAQSLPGHGGRLCAEWLGAAYLPAKGNFLTQVQGVDELHLPGEKPPAIRVPNPLRAPVMVTRSLCDAV